MNPPLPNTVVFDAFGTLVTIAKPTRPFARLRHYLSTRGADVSRFSRLAMTQPISLAGLAHLHGIEAPMALLGSLEADLQKELESVRPFPEAMEVLRFLLGQGVTVVVGSNLGWPYGTVVRSVLESAGSLRMAFSYEMGVMKPEPAFYQEVAQSVRPASVVGLPSLFMVGDRRQEDYEAPLAAGWTAWHLERSLGFTLWDGLKHRGWVLPHGTGVAVGSR